MAAHMDGRGGIMGAQHLVKGTRVAAHDLFTSSLGGTTKMQVAWATLRSARGRTSVASALARSRLSLIFCTLDKNTF